MVRAIVCGDNLPVRNGHGKIAGEGHINMGLAERGLKCGDITHILDMESMAEEEILKFRAPWILVRSIDSAVGIGVHRQNNPR